MKVTRRHAAALLSPLGLFLLVVAVPAGILFVYSFYGYNLFRIEPGFHLEWYKQIFDQPLYRTVAWNTAAIAVPTTAITVIGGYAIAYYVAFCATRSRRLLLALVIISMLSSYLARVYAWRTLMGGHGVINSGLESLGLTHGPVAWLLFSRLAIILAEVSLYMPIATLILFASLSGVAPELRAVSRDLGAGRAQTLRRVTLPLTGRAILGASLLSFFLSCGDYVTPSFLGGRPPRRRLEPLSRRQYPSTGTTLLARRCPS